MLSALKASKVPKMTRGPSKSAKGKGKAIPEKPLIVESSSEDSEGSSDKETGDVDEEKAVEGPFDGKEDEGEEEEGDIALDDVDDSVDEDAVPRQKIEVDNKVRGLVGKYLPSCVDFTFPGCS